MMAKITGEPKTQAAKDILEFIGGKAGVAAEDAAHASVLDNASVSLDQEPRLL
jgi:hypothetical protein